MLRIFLYSLLFALPLKANEAPTPPTGRYFVRGDQKEHPCAFQRRGQTQSHIYKEFVGSLEQRNGKPTYVLNGSPEQERQSLSYGPKSLFPLNAAVSEITQLAENDWKFEQTSKESSLLTGAKFGTERIYRIGRADDSCISIWVREVSHTLGPFNSPASSETQILSCIACQ